MFANLSEFAATITAYFNKPPRGVDGSQGVTSQDVKQAILDAGTFMTEQVAAAAVAAASLPLSWNAATNSPALTADASALPANNFYIVTTGGVSTFAGNNFAVGQTFAVGDQLRKTGTQWFRVPFAVGDLTITKTKLEQTIANNIDALVAAAGLPVLSPYTKDFSSLSLSSGTNTTFINNVPITTRGKLSSVRVKTTVGATVTVSVYSIITTPTLSFTLLHTYSTFVTTSAIHTQTILDPYVIEAGQYVAVKSNQPLSYGTGGGTAYNVEAVTSNSLTIAYDFVIDTTVVPGLVSKVAALETTSAANSTTLTAVDTAVGVDISTPYTLDFTGFSLSGGANATYINRIPLLRRGKLSSIRVKTSVGSTITVSVYSVTASPLGFTLLYTYATFVTTSAIHTQTILDSYVIEAGQYVAVKSTSAWSYGMVGNAWWVEGNTYNGLNIAYDFTINERISSGLTGRVNALELQIGTYTGDITDLKAGLYPSQVSLKPAILYRNNMSSLADFNNVGWSVSGGAAVPSGIGIANKLWLQKRYHVQPRQMAIEITLLADSVFYIDCLPLDYTYANGAFAVDVVQNKLIILSSAYVEITSGTIPFTLVAGRRYAVKLGIENLTHTFEICDIVTGQIYTLSHTINTGYLGPDNRQFDSYAFYLQSGATSGFKIHSLTISSKYAPNLMLFGDSITDGGYFATSNFLTSRYGAMLKTKLKGDMLISARGGSVLADVAQKLETEVFFIRPRYVMLTIGTNNTGFTEAALTTVVNRIIELGSIPILNHVPNRSDNSHVAKNVIIGNVCAATGAIRGARFDVATSTNGDPAAAHISAYYFGDGIHPNSIGQPKMFDRFEIDVPFLVS